MVNEQLSLIETPEEHIIYFDNFFSSYALLNELRQKRFKAVGTSKCLSVPCKELGKQNRGDFDYNGDGKIICVRWNDNSVVTLISNWIRALPTQNVKRYSAKQK